MKNISELKYTKKGKSCIIVGGGYSAKDIEFDIIKKMGLDIIAINYYFFDIEPTFYIHSDKILDDWYDEIQTDVPSISYFKNNLKHASYVYRLGDKIQYSLDDDHLQLCSHTPPYAVQICDLMGYENIYLIGLDYSGKLDLIHYYDNFQIINHRNFDMNMRIKYINFKHNAILPRDAKYFEKQYDMYEKRMFNTGNDLACLNDYKKIKISSKVYNVSCVSKLDTYEFKDIFNKKKYYI